MHYVIIGGDAAGMSAAMQIWKHDKTAKITILEAGNTYSYGQCGLPYVISGDIAEVSDVIARTPEDYFNFGMKAHIYTRVTKVDPTIKKVHGFHVRTGESFTYSYDKLLIATGAAPVKPHWPGSDLQNLHVLKTIDDTQEIMDNLRGDVGHVSIIGGGYIALEMAEAFKKRDLDVHLFIRGKRMLRIFDEDMMSFVREEAESHHIHLHFEEEAKRFLGSEKVNQIETNKGIYDTDLVLIAAGVRPSIEFLQETNIKTAVKQAVEVNEWMETNIDDIYAAGDCATAYHRLLQTNVHIPLGTTANKQGRIAGLNMVGKKRAFKGIIGTSILQFMNITLGRTGISETEAIDHHIPYETVMITASHIAGYFPGAKAIHVKLVFHKETRVLLGAQIIGESGVDKRIDVMVTAITNQMTIDDLEDLDLSYAPPYNGVWDPLQKAARKAAQS